MKVRLAKAIAESGIVSRRKAEELILAGRVLVDDIVVQTPVFFVDDSNIIKVDGKEIKKKSDKIRIWKLYKPTGYITTRTDPKKRKTVFDLIDIPNERLLYIGRLDINSEGLLLFTNNGDISRYFELPTNHIQRTYKVRIYGTLSPKIVASIKHGVTVDGIDYGSIDISVEAQKNTANQWIKMTLYEGKNREIRKVLGKFGIQVSRLIRIAYAGFTIDGVKPGAFIEVADEEVQKVIKGLT